MTNTQVELTTEAELMTKSRKLEVTTDTNVEMVTKAQLMTQTDTSK